VHLDPGATIRQRRAGGPPRPGTDARHSGRAEPRGQRVPGALPRWRPRTASAASAWRGPPQTPAHSRDALFRFDTGIARIRRAGGSPRRPRAPTARGRHV